MSIAAARALAGAFALASAVPLWFGFWIALLNIAVSTQPPDPTIPNGDPCCWHPDTWVEVAGGIALGIGTLVAWAALIYTVVALVRFALTGKTPANRQRRRLTISASLLALWAATHIALPMSL
ncbi:MAG: hypothetical protein H0V26_11670 [Solirubrobacterales bacterium]|nr:hypothetical protein [Solirubrobacterales bacterium]